MTYAPFNTKTSFLNTSEVFPKDPSQLLTKMTGLQTDVANCVNVREIAIYQENQPILTGQQFSIPKEPTKKKYTFRQVYYFAAIAPGASLLIPHNITGLVQFTNIYGTCVTAIDFRPLPYVSIVASANCVSLTVTLTDIVIANGAAADAIVSGMIILEYLLN